MQPDHANQLRLQLGDFALPFMFLLATVVKRSLQQFQISPQLHLPQHQPAQRLQRFFSVAESSRGI